MNAERMVTVNTLAEQIVTKDPEKSKDITEKIENLNTT